MMNCHIDDHNYHKNSAQQSDKYCIEVMCV